MLSLKSVQCNIDKTDRINRTVIGAVICLAALLGFGRAFYFLLGAVMIVQGIIGWCSIPILYEKFKAKIKK